MGLAGETGEVVDLIKKHLFQKATLSREDLIKELGDVRWYFELMCYCAGTTIEEVERLNVEKLARRHPKGWTPESANRRIDQDTEDFTNKSQAV
jgi:NTP pyrophosphatase (non-canonical NTP hydrolase)